MARQPLSTSQHYLFVNRFCGHLFDIKPNHKNLGVIAHNWKTGTFDNEAIVSLVFTKNDPQKTLDLSDSTLWNGFLNVVYLGLSHMWEGLDHSFFLLALLIPAVLRREKSPWQPVEHFRPALIYVIKIAITFTVALSIRLAPAPLDLRTFTVDGALEAVAGLHTGQGAGWVAWHDATSGRG